MGSFLLKEEEIEDEEPKQATSIESFIHLEQNPIRASNVKVIVISTAAVVALVISAFIIFKSSPAPQPIVIIPEDTNVKERIVEHREKHEDKKIYNYLQTIDNERIVASSVDRKSPSDVSDNAIDEIDTEFDKLDKSGVTKTDSEGVLTGAYVNPRVGTINQVDSVNKIEPANTSDDMVIVTEKNELTNQEKKSLEKIDDLIKSLVDRSTETTKFSDGTKPDANVAARQTVVADGPDVQSQVRPTVSETRPETPAQVRTDNAPTRSERPVQVAIDTAKLEQFVEKSGGAYRINLGTFETHSEAMKTITKLHSDKTAGEYMKKIPYYIIAVDDEIGVVSYKVLLGGFKLKEQALDLAKAILTLFSNASHL